MKALNLTDIVFSRRGWIWSSEKLKLTRDVHWICPINIGNRTWTSKDGYLVITGDLWTFKKDYEWNGATGVPSGEADKSPDLPVISLTNKPVPILWMATLVHDVGCDESTNDPTFPFKRFMIDYFFYELSKIANFRWSLLYYIGVRVLGKPLSFLTKILGKLKRLWK